MKLNQGEVCANIVRGLIAQKKAKASLLAGWRKERNEGKGKRREKRKKKFQRTMEKVFAYPRVSSVTIAPDSNRIVYFPHFLHTPPATTRSKFNYLRPVLRRLLQLYDFVPLPRGKDRESPANRSGQRSSNDFAQRLQLPLWPLTTPSLTLFSTSCWCRRPFSCLPVTVFWPTFFQGVPNATFTGSYKFSAWSSSFPAWWSCIEWNRCISSPFTGFWASLPPFWPSSCPWPAIPFL